jgi:hypothetical protein
LRRLSDLDNELGVSNENLMPRLKKTLVDPLTIDDGAIGAVEVDELDLVWPLRRIYYSMDSRDAVIVFDAKMTPCMRADLHNVTIERLGSHRLTLLINLKGQRYNDP